VKIEIKYQEHGIKEVWRYFVDGLKSDEGEVESFDANYDPHTGKVIFRLYINTEKKP